MEVDVRALSKTELKQLQAVIEKARRASPSTLPSEKVFYDPIRDGVTFSALTAFKRCREMSRLNLKGVTARGMSGTLIFGIVTHGVLQTIYTDLRNKRLTGVPRTEYVKFVLKATEKEWRRENPRAPTDAFQAMEFALTLAEATLPRYFKYWFDDFNNKVQWMKLEEEFRVPYTVKPAWSSKHITLPIRGKMDGNFKMEGGIWLLETKTKGHIDEATTSDILPYELQVNLYLWAMRQLHSKRPAGVRYNIIRRPQLRQRKAETIHQFAMRCAEDVSLRPDWYFVRLDMLINQSDMDRFEGELEDLVTDFLSWWYGHAGHYHNSWECENRYGKCHYLPICGPRQYALFYKRDSVFRELEDF